MLNVRHLNVLEHILGGAPNQLPASIHRSWPAHGASSPLLFSNSAIPRTEEFRRVFDCACRWSIGPKANLRRLGVRDPNPFGRGPWVSQSMLTKIAGEISNLTATIICESSR